VSFLAKSLGGGFADEVAGCPLKKILKPAQMRERVVDLEEA
jgi:hypothetical protein